MTSSRKKKVDDGYDVYRKGASTHYKLAKELEGGRVDSYHLGYYRDPASYSVMECKEMAILECQSAIQDLMHVPEALLREKDKEQLTKYYERKAATYDRLGLHQLASFERNTGGTFKQAVNRDSVDQNVFLEEAEEGRVSLNRK